MRPTDNIKKLIKNAKINLDPASKKAGLAHLIDELQKSTASHPAEQTLNIWSIIMKSKITKLTVAAVIIFLVIFSITIFDKTVTPAWAIEDTIKALENVCSIKISGIVSGADKDGKIIEKDFVLWTKPNEDNTETGELRFEIPDLQTTVVTPSGTTYIYKKNQNVVTVKEYKDFSINPWLNSKFFNGIKKFVENWQVSYGKDEETGKESIFVTFLHPTDSQSWWFQFDPETKLPIRFKQWVNTKFEGKPQFYAVSIEYNIELPDRIFEFDIPDGAKVVKVAKKFPQYFDDPNVGILVDDLTDEEACQILVQDYWRAVIDGDWEYLAKLRPICDVKEWELKYKRNETWPTKVLEIGQPSKEKNCNIGPVVPCKIKYSNDQIKNIQLIVRIRNINGIKSCVIAGTFGKVADFER